MIDTTTLTRYSLAPTTDRSGDDARRKRPWTADSTAAAHTRAAGAIPGRTVEGV
jgi:hypothetical protein